MHSGFHGLQIFPKGLQLGHGHLAVSILIPVYFEFLNSSKISHENQA